MCHIGYILGCKTGQPVSSRKLADCPHTGWVFYSPRADRRSNPKFDGTYTVQGFWDMLRRAEDRADVTHVEGGAAHRMRRMAAGNALEVTGNVADAMWWIGDTDLRQAQKYLKKRDHRMRDIAAVCPP